jgi:sigma-E factor negative regulatory protein RseC
MDPLYGETQKRSNFYMNEEEGIVREIRDAKALVVTDRRSMCGQCAAHGFCEMIGGGKEMIAEATNPLGAKAGDTVKIGIPHGTVTKASTVVYLIPALGLVGGAALGYYVGKLNGFDINVAALIGSVAGIGAAMIWVRRLSSALSKKPSFQPQIIKILTPDAGECEEATPP